MNTRRRALTRWWCARSILEWVAVALMAAAILGALCLTLSAGDPEFSAIATIQQHDTYDFRGIEFFELHFRGESVTVSADADTALATYLRSQNGRKVRITVAPFELERIER